MKVRRPGGLVLQIYLWSVLLVVLPVIGLVSLQLWLAEPAWKPSFERFGKYVISNIAHERHNPAGLKEELDRVQHEVSGSVALYSPDGVLLGGTAHPPAPMSADDVAKLRRGSVLIWTSQRKAIVPVVEDGQFVAYGVFQARPRTDTTMMRLELTVLLLLAAGGLASFLLARRLSRPLQQLATAASRIGHGDLSARSGVDRRDELGEVARAFDDMASRVAQLLRSQKELLANVSHELRTPLARIRVALDLAEEGDAAGARESLGEIALDLAELERLVEDILTAVRMDLASGAAAYASPLHLERVASAGLLQKAVSHFATAHPARQLAVDIAQDVPELVADPTLIRRVIENLLDNAAKYSEAPQPIAMHSRLADGNLIVEVVDHGIGIDEADRPHLFTPFFRSDRSRNRKTGGVGLGLALAKRIVEAHGGSIRLESLPGGETTASVTMPIAGPPGAPPVAV